MLCRFLTICDPDNGTSCGDYFNILDHKLSIDTLNTIDAIDTMDIQTNDADNNTNEPPVGPILSTFRSFSIIQFSPTIPDFLYVF